MAQESQVTIKRHFTIIIKDLYARTNIGIRA